MDTHIIYRTDACVLDLLDQRKLPLVEERFLCKNTADIIYALKTMVVRGAPAIGVTAAYGSAIAAKEVSETPDWKQALEKNLLAIRDARPTAVNLAWAIDRMRSLWKEHADAGPEAVYDLFLEEARTIQSDDVASCKAQGRFGLPCFHDGDTIMTHCNAGALATAGYGTALGVIRAAFDAYSDIRVIANETRPFLQGARLTAYELHKDGIPVTVACDNACALLMAKGMVQAVVVGADRIAANGDTANKIGTSGVALLAHHFHIPFYVAAPTTTIDLKTPSGKFIPIEQRPAEEVTTIGGHRIVPDGVPVYNFAFDVTPAEYITAIITDKGLVKPPFTNGIAALFA